MYNFTRGQMPVGAFTKGQFTKYQLTGTYDTVPVDVEEPRQGGGGGGWKLIESQISAYVHDDDGVQIWLTSDSDYEFGSTAKVEKAAKGFVSESGIELSVALESETNRAAIRESGQRIAVELDGDVEFYSALPDLLKKAEEELLILLAMLDE